MSDIIFSVIIPHRNSVQFLPKLFSSIQERDDLEIILVDNSPTPVTKDDIGVEREYTLLYSDPSRGAGGARNEGIEHAIGKWMIFADADDYFADDAFDVFYLKANSDADIIYTCMAGKYIDSDEPCTRGSSYTKLVHNYLAGIIPEQEIRMRFSSPCCKMVRGSMVKDQGLRYDEVIASNDLYFSMLCGFYAKAIEAVDKVTYVATISKGTLTKRKDLAIIESRFIVFLRYNQFLREHNLSEYQFSVMYYMTCAMRFGIKPLFKFCSLLIKYRQNPLYGCTNWIRTFFENRRYEKKESRYIIR